MQHTSKNIILVAIFFVVSHFFASNKDSLIKVINNPESSNRVLFFAYYELGWEYIYESHDSTLVYARKALSRAETMNSPHLQSKAYNLLGSYYQVKKDYLKAIDNYQKCQKLGESLNDDEAVLLAFGNLGAMYLNLGQYNKAIEYQEKSLIIAQKGDDIKRIASIFNNLSIGYDGIKKYEKALSYAKKSLELYTKLNDLNGIGSVYGSLGNINYHLNRLDEALDNYKKNNSIAIQIGNVYEEIVSYYEIGDIYFNKKQYGLALEFYNKAVIKSEEINDLESLKSTYGKLYKLYKEKGDAPKALEYYEKSVLKSEELEKLSITEELQKKELQYEFRKRAESDSLKNVTANLEKDLKLKQNDAQIEKEKIIRIALIIGCFIAIAFGVFVINRYRIIVKQNRIIASKSKQTEEQKSVIEHKNKEITDSLNYAKRIQQGILASDKLLTNYLSQYFVLFKPKDIVSGDFYWAAEHDNRFYLAVCDSTGHGVPGAFMSILNIGLLSEAVKEKNIKAPHEILNYVRNRLEETISGDGQKDGMDGILLCFELSSPLKKIDDVVCKISYSAANNVPMLLRDNNFIELKKDRMPIGKGEKDDSFSLHTIDVKKGDMLYLYTDGFADQFGGPNGKKFKYKQLNDTLTENSKLPLEQQQQKLSKKFEEWKGNSDQVDDVCIFGIRI